MPYSCSLTLEEANGQKYRPSPLSRAFSLPLPIAQRFPVLAFSLGKPAHLFLGCLLLAKPLPAEIGIFAMSASGFPQRQPSGSSAGSDGDQSASQGSHSPYPPALPLQQGDMHHRHVSDSSESSGSSSGVELDQDLVPQSPMNPTEPLHSDVVHSQSFGTAGTAAPTAPGGLPQKKMHVDPTLNPRPATARGDTPTTTAAAGVPEQAQALRPNRPQEAVTTLQAVTANAAQAGLATVATAGPAVAVAGPTAVPPTGGAVFRLVPLKLASEGFDAFNAGITREPLTETQGQPLTPKKR